MGDWEHGDPFPLPRPDNRSHALRLSPAFASAAPSHRRRVSSAVVTLNQLVAARAGPNSNLARSSFPRAASATNFQRRILDSLLRRIRAYGEPSESLRPVAAFAELLAAKGLYALEPQNLARFELSHLRVAKEDVVPKRASLLLPRLDAAYLERFDRFIERPASLVAAIRESGDLPLPYMDLVLAGTAPFATTCFACCSVCGSSVRTCRSRRP